jgi:hypothetical protein
MYALSVRGTRSYSFTTDRTSPRRLASCGPRTYVSRLGCVTGGAPKVIEENFSDGSKKKPSECSTESRRSATYNLLRRRTGV